MNTKPMGSHIYLSKSGRVKVSGIEGVWDLVAQNNLCLVLKKRASRAAMGSRTSLLGTAYYSPELQVFEIVSREVREEGLIYFAVQGLISWELTRKEKKHA